MFLSHRKLRERDHSKLRIQLSIALICLLVVFAAGVNRTEIEPVCVTVGAVLHYFLLVTWMWMGAESLLLFQKLVIVFVNTSKQYLITLSIICWGKLLHTHVTRI